MSENEKNESNTTNSTESGSATTDPQVNKSSKSSDPSLKNAWKQVENIGQALGEALQGRGNVVMVRVNDEALNYLDMLVEAEVVKSRSEAAALLINEGVQANQELFEKIGLVTQQINALRQHLRQTVNDHNLE
jgi:hypothetical protein